jgi:hypothetical protein
MSDSVVRLILSTARGHLRLVLSKSRFTGVLPTSIARASQIPGSLEAPGGRMRAKVDLMSWRMLSRSSPGGGRLGSTSARTFQWLLSQLSWASPRLYCSSRRVRLFPELLGPTMTVIGPGAISMGVASGVGPNLKRMDLSMWYGRVFRASGGPWLPGYRPEVPGSVCVEGEDGTVLDIPLILGRPYHCQAIMARG